MWGFAFCPFFTPHSPGRSPKSRFTKPTSLRRVWRMRRTRRIFLSTGQPDKIKLRFRSVALGRRHPCLPGLPAGAGDRVPALQGLLEDRTCGGRFNSSLLLSSFALPACISFRRRVRRTIQSRKSDFDREVRPILSDNCFSPVTGRESAQGEAALRHEGWRVRKTGRDHAGRRVEIEAIKRVSSKDQDMVMPPPSSEHKLTEKQIETIRRWIDEGARWDEHWAFIPPKRPEIPKVANAAWVRNPIDSDSSSRGWRKKA